MKLRSFVPLFASSLFTFTAADGLSQSQLEKHVNSLTLQNSFNPVEAAYWTGYPHHRRTPFAVSPDGTAGYLAYLDASETDVHVQQVDLSTFKATGTPVTVSGAKEAGGLVAHNDGFALLTNEALPSGTANAPAGSTPVPVLYRYTGGSQTWKTFLGGPGVSTSFGLVASPDINGDLVYSEASGYYAAYIVITAYTGDAAGHYGDAIRYVTSSGELKTIAGASSDWGCSHNTGIAFEAADQPPFASICAEDQGAIWLNTKTQGMGNDGVKISNEHVINGASNEPMGGMSGSYSNLVRFIDSNAYMFAWVSRGAIDLTANEWMGDGYTKAENRTANRNVAIASFSDKNTLVGNQATSTVGAEDGDSQVNWVTSGNADCSNAHVAAFDSSKALVTWEEIANPICDFDAMGCRGDYSGTFFQLVTSDGKKVGEPITVTDTYVAGDMVTMADGRICWPYVSMTWDLSAAVGAGLQSTSTTSMSFACMNLNGTSVGSTSATTSSRATSQTASASSSSTSTSAITTKATTSSKAKTASSPVSSTSHTASHSPVSPSVSKSSTTSSVSKSSTTSSVSNTSAASPISQTAASSLTGVSPTTVSATSAITTAPPKTIDTKSSVNTAPATTFATSRRQCSDWGKHQVHTAWGA